MARATSRTSVKSGSDGRHSTRNGRPARAASTQRESAMSERCPSPTAVNGRATTVGPPVSRRSSADALGADLALRVTTHRLKRIVLTAGPAEPRTAVDR